MAGPTLGEGGPGDEDEAVDAVDSAREIEEVPGPAHIAHNSEFDPDTGERMGTPSRFLRSVRTGDRRPAFGVPPTETGCLSGVELLAHSAPDAHQGGYDGLRGVARPRPSTRGRGPEVRTPWQWVSEVDGEESKD